MTPTDFRVLMSGLTSQIAGRALDQDLAAWLNKTHGVGSPMFQALKDACLTGVAEGWLCPHEGAGLRYGRACKPALDLQDFSVDVVDMANIAGPHHRHPLGEIVLILPIDAGACFDGHPAGWEVSPAGSAHYPTVTGGRAIVLYLLPQGKIEFTK